MWALPEPPHSCAHLILSQERSLTLYGVEGMDPVQAQESWPPDHRPQALCGSLDRAAEQMK